MDYATQKESLILAEYGRHVQEMVTHTMKIEDRKTRSDAAETIVRVMSQLHPSYKGSEELQQKLWEDLFIISGFQLDVDSPFPTPTPKIDIRPEKIEYPNQHFKFKHYGKIIEGLIESAIAIENPEEQQELTQLIAHLMKRSYLNYNRDSVNEEMIVDQLTSMSSGKLKLDPDFKFQHTNEILSQMPKKPSNRNQGKGRGKRKWKK
jgi:hypothetical protein